MSKKKNALLRDAGFRSIADALDQNAARTTEAIWASVDEVHAANAARVTPATDSMEGIPTIPSVGQRRP
jgi:succinylarginine dihydrolase